MDNDNTDQDQGLQFIEKYQNEIPNEVKFNFEKMKPFDSLDTLLFFVGIFMDILFFLLIVVAVAFVFKKDIANGWKYMTTKSVKEDKPITGINRLEFKKPLTSDTAGNSEEISRTERLIKNLKESKLGTMMFPNKPGTTVRNASNVEVDLGVPNKKRRLVENTEET